MRDVESAAADLRAGAVEFNRRRQRALEAEETSERRRLDEQIMATERALLDPEGLPGRPWFRHSVFAPKFSYAPGVLPGVAEAVEAGENDRAVGGKLGVLPTRCAAPQPLSPELPD